MFKKTHLLSVLMLALLVGACSQPAEKPAIDKLKDPYQPEWTKSANIYEVNIRQYSEEGTFNAFREEMPRLADMGVDILWLMPINPIGMKNRKGELGSYYSVSDYKGINPNYGTLDDFKALVAEAHELGMKVIIDWVPNHTAWDHPWITEHPEFYAKDDEGNITYEADWTDIALLNYNNSKELWSMMTDAMAYWVEVADIDGFRVDHAAHEIPMEFWNEAIPAVDEKKDDLFWLAEWNESKLYPTFDASYAWEYFHLSTEIAKGEKSFVDLDEYMAHRNEKFPVTAYLMYFTTNHDENSWNGTDQELFGDNFENFSVLAATMDGMFLVYSGQETAMDKQLKFFESDPIEWDGYEYEDFYSTLYTLIDDNPALWNGAYGGDFKRIESPEGTFAFSRTKGSNEVIVAVNISEDDKEISVPVWSASNYTKFGVTEGDFSTDGSKTYDFELPANEWFILTANN
ncbi:MAG TPA: alpha-amylase [Balneolaceae bacterium]|nr:alpha-amylase [Balneolaceae bacterium]